MSDHNNRFSRKPSRVEGNDRFKNPKSLHTAQCSNCNATCEVPFRPNGKKPVFCRNCFAKNNVSLLRPSYGAKRENTAHPFTRPESAMSFHNDRALQDVKTQLLGINDKLARLISILETLVYERKAKVRSK
jgi:CxxC-x17-CxxC domain-containing protein